MSTRGIGVTIVAWPISETRDLVQHPTDDALGGDAAMASCLFGMPTVENESALPEYAEFFELGCTQFVAAT